MFFSSSIFILAQFGWILRIIWSRMDIFLSQGYLILQSQCSDGTQNGQMKESWRWNNLQTKLFLSFMLHNSNWVHCSYTPGVLVQNGQIREADEIPCKRDESYLDLMLYITQLVKILYWEWCEILLSWRLSHLHLELVCMQSLFRVRFNKRQFLIFLWYIIKDWQGYINISLQHFQLNGVVVY